MKTIVIIGAGPSGLTLAYRLLKESKNYKVIVIEESKDMGGISKTINHHGNRMDIGGHRFFTKDSEVMEFWKEICPIQGKLSKDDIIINPDKELNPNGPDPEKDDNCLLIRRRISRILYDGKFFDYPVSFSFSTIKSLGFINTILCGFSYLKSTIFKKKNDSLENFYINRFGKRLYNMFFENYTEKVWGRHPKEISSDWGSQRVKGISIIEVFKAFFHKSKETSLIEEFYYPKYGPGALYEELAKRCTSLGATIIRNAKVVEIHKNKNSIDYIIYEKDNKRTKIKTNVVASSASIKDLINMMNDVPKKISNLSNKLPYRDFITVGVLVNKLLIENNTKQKTINNIVPDTWIYVQDKNVKMGRIQVFNNWSPYLVKDSNKVWIGLEYFCNENDSFWNKKDNSIKAFAINELEKIKFVDKDDILDTCVTRIKKAYPAYFDTYSKIDTVKDYLFKIDNLYCIGRNGQHRYNNMDHSIKTAMIASTQIINNKKDNKELWNVNTEKEYHEKK